MNHSIILVETTTTPPICDGDNEEYKCYNHYIMCNESCRMMQNMGACENLREADDNMGCDKENFSCACIDGYKRYEISCSLGSHCKYFDT